MRSTNLFIFEFQSYNFNLPCFYQCPLPCPRFLCPLQFCLPVRQILFFLFLFFFLLISVVRNTSTNVFITYHILKIVYSLYTNSPRLISKLEEQILLITLWLILSKFVNKICWLLFNMKNYNPKTDYCKFMLIVNMGNKWWNYFEDRLMDR